MLEHDVAHRVDVLSSHQPAGQVHALEYLGPAHAMVLHQAQSAGLGGVVLLTQENALQSAAVLQPPVGPVVPVCHHVLDSNCLDLPGLSSALVLPASHLTGTELWDEYL